MLDSFTTSPPFCRLGYDNCLYDARGLGGLYEAYIPVLRFNAPLSYRLYTLMFYSIRAIIPSLAITPVPWENDTVFTAFLTGACLFFGIYTGAMWWLRRLGPVHPNADTCLFICLIIPFIGVLAIVGDRTLAPWAIVAIFIDLTIVVPVLARQYERWLREQPPPE